MTDRPRSSWLARLLRIGLGCFAIVIILISAAVILNWERLRTVYQTRVASLSELQTVRTALQAKYRTPDIAVFSRRLLSQPSGAGLPNRTLRVELVNPPFLKNLAEDELEGKARDIATDARAAHRSPDDFDSYEVILTNRKGFVVTGALRRHFVFQSDELSTPPDAPTPGTESR